MTINGLSGQYANQIFPVNGQMVFGRNVNSCNVLFPDDTKGISRMHCKVEMEGDTIIITDLGSSYGTFVNGSKLQPYAPRKLNPGDTFYLGDKNNLFSLTGTAAASAPAAEEPVAARNNPEDKSLLIAAIVLGAVVIIGLVVVMLQRLMRPAEPWYIQMFEELFINITNTGRILLWR